MCPGFDYHPCQGRKKRCPIFPAGNMNAACVPMFNFLVHIMLVYNILFRAVPRKSVNASLQKSVNLIKMPGTTWNIFPCALHSINILSSNGKRNGESESIPYGLEWVLVFFTCGKRLSFRQSLYFFLHVCYHFPIRNPLKKHI